MKKYFKHIFLVVLSICTFLSPAYTNATVGVVVINLDNYVDYARIAACKLVPESYTIVKEVHNPNIRKNKYYFADEEGNIRYKIELHSKTYEVISVTMMEETERAGMHSLSTAKVKKSVKNILPNAVIKNIRKAAPKWKNGKLRNHIYIASFTLRNYKGKAYINGNTGSVYKYIYEK